MFNTSSIYTDWLHSVLIKWSCLTIHSTNSANKRCIFCFLMTESGEDANNAKVQVRLYREAATEWPPVPTQHTLRQQARRLCSVIPRYPYTKPHAQQLVLPEEFNNSWWKLDGAFVALLAFSTRGALLNPHSTSFRFSGLLLLHFFIMWDRKQGKMNKERQHPTVEAQIYVPAQQPGHLKARFHVLLKAVATTRPGGGG